MSSTPPPRQSLHGVGSTGDTFCKTIQEYNSSQPAARRRRVGKNGAYSNLFREAQFSADGTTIVTHSEDEFLRTFILPPDLLDDRTSPSKLEAYSEIQSPTSTLSYSLYPHFDLQNSATTLALAASKDVPLSLRNALHYETIHASYPLIDAPREAFVTPHALTWTSDGTHFLAGSKDQIAIFDASRDGEGPEAVHKTAPGRTAKKLYGAQDINSCKGIVSTLSISSDGLLAAGTLDRNIGLFDHSGFQDCSTAFSLSFSLDGSARDGTGITHLHWSPCGKYLIVAERQSDSIHVYDVRSTHRRVCRLSGRRAATTQKLGFDVLPASKSTSGLEVWAGGTDGCVRKWVVNAGIDVEEEASEQAPDLETNMHDGECELIILVLACSPTIIR